MTKRTSRRWRAAIGIALAALTLPAAAAQAVELPAGSTAILSGATSLREALPAPVGPSAITRQTVSTNGRYVAFDSTSDGLLPGDDDRVRNVYVKDQVTGDVVLASRENGADGTPGHVDCFDAALSDDGKRVAFVCRGPLDRAADTNEATDVYLRDMSQGYTELVSRAGGRGVVADFGSSEPALSATGEHVAFTSGATNLDPLAPASPTGRPDRVYVRRIGGGDQTQVVSRLPGPSGVPISGRQPSISNDGNRIAFVTNASVDPIDNGRADVHVRDMAAQTTELVSRASGTGAIGNADSEFPSISGNGIAVAFESRATTLDPTRDNDSAVDVYWRSLASGATRLVSITAAGVKAPLASRPSIDDGGSRVTFVTTATTFDPADTDAPSDAYLKNVTTGGLELLSRANGVNGAAANLNAGTTSISGNGEQVAMALQGGLTPDTDPRVPGVFVRELPQFARQTLAVSRPAGTAPFVNEGGAARRAQLSDDGRYAAFTSGAPGLGLPAGVSRGAFVRDRVTGEATLVSREDGPGGAPMTGTISSAAISADGRRVAFVRSAATSLVYVRDVPSGRTFLVSRADGAAGVPADRQADNPSLDADGSRVAFETSATNLGNGDTDTVLDVHVRDLATDRTLLVSRADGEAGAKGDAASSQPSINADGTSVAFTSYATNLADGDADATRDVHLRDVAAGRTRLVSVTTEGTKADDASGSPAIDASGDRVAFDSQAKNLPGATAPFTAVYLRDVAAGTLEAVSRADDHASGPAISSDGRYVAFSSVARNLAGGTPVGITQAYLRDVVSGELALVSRHDGAEGAPAATVATATDVSTGGGCVALQGTSLVGRAHDLSQVFVRTLRANCAATDPVAVEQPTGNGTGGPNGDGAGPRGAARDTVAPVLSRARLSRKRFGLRRGTVLRFRSSEQARLTITVERARRGRKRGASVTRTVKAGASRVTLRGRIGRKRLAPGRYRMRLVARDAAGNTSKAVVLRFTIVRG